MNEVLVEVLHWKQVNQKEDMTVTESKESRTRTRIEFEGS